MRCTGGGNHFPLALDVVRSIRFPVNILDPNSNLTVEKNLAGRDLGDEVVVRACFNDTVVVGKS